MVYIQDTDAIGGSGGSGTGPGSTEFESERIYRRYTGDGFEVASTSVVFAPRVYPLDIVVSKERNVTREDNLCAGESVDDTGSKNREINIVGIIRQSEKVWFDELLDDDGPHDLISQEWTGEVQVLDGEYRKVGLDTYQYKLNLLSTGRDETGGTPGSGILDVGSADPNVLDGFQTRADNTNSGVETGL